MSYRTIRGLLLLVVLLISTKSYGEGSFQAGLNQPLQDFSISNSYFYVDIIAAGEVINVALCGNADSDSVRVRIYDSGLNLLQTDELATGNIPCNDPMNSAISNPVKFLTPEIGTYLVTLENTGSNGLLKRFDISVTANENTDPDPTAALGRLSSLFWSFNAGTFAESAATNADYFALVPGARPNTNYVWKLDLNNFAGYRYNIIANDIGVNAPYSGYSTSTADNSITPKFPIYLHYPVIADPKPTEPPLIGGFRFIDNADQDFSISPVATTGIQDQGYFEFTSDVAGTYAIIIDSNQDGEFGSGDVMLLGNSIVGLNRIVWDGKDRQGNDLTNTTYRAKLSSRLGEYHFVAEDVETSGGNQDGFTIYLANTDGSTEDTRVFWDSETLLGGSTTLPDGALSSSTAAKHTWGNFTSDSIGNQSFIDTYVYGLQSTALTLVKVSNSDAVTAGTDGSLSGSLTSVPGDVLNVSVTDADLNLHATVIESVSVQLSNERSGEIEQVILTETTANSGIFTGTLSTVASANHGLNNDGALNTVVGDSVTFTYYEQTDATGQSTTRTLSHSVDVDSDGDGISNTSDLDDDNDGILDSQEGNNSVDTDGDSINDSLDLDSDNDGIFDLVESGANYSALDLDNDGRIDSSNAVGSNGVADSIETAVDSGLVDYDGDGNADSPKDSDSDSVPDFLDNNLDNDGVADNDDLDDDNDGIPDSEEGSGTVDSDGDGVADSLDLDSDNDGIFDLVEAGVNSALFDLDNDGRIDLSNAVGANGLADAIETAVDSGVTDYNADSVADSPADIDGDGVPDFIDLDSDNDGLSDVVEGGGSDPDTNGYVGTGNPPDVDNNGVTERYGLPLPDSDGDGTPDLKDTDADGDGIFDIVEIGLPDSNNNGVIDAFSDINGNGFDDSTPISDISSLPDSDGDGIPDYRDNGDTDNDGLLDTVDVDDDNDGIPDLDEGSAAVDTDGDGVPDSRDLDSDNDGIYDLREAGANADTLDTNNDGRIDSTFTVGANGLADIVETAVDSGVSDYDGDGNADTLQDTDSDSVFDFRDSNSDGDSMSDVIEAGGSDPDNDGFLNSGPSTIVDISGLASGAGLIPIDSDNDSVPDYLDNDLDNDGVTDANDADTDNDGIPDAAEGSGTVDTDGDGVADNVDLDSDNDGIFDLYESGADYTTLDLNSDGKIDAGFAVGSNGLVDSIETFSDSGITDYNADAQQDSPLDSDADGVADFRDIDSDNDSLTDVTEAGGSDPDSNGYQGSGYPPVVNYFGLASGAGFLPLDSDNDGIPDYLELDSNDDGLWDITSSGATDVDNNGIIDNFTDLNGDGYDDATSIPDTDSGSIPQIPINNDMDNDGLLNSIDLDDDNDGIPDVNEGSGLIDTDGDGIVDSLDLDSDNDGIFDLHESGANFSILDRNNDGRIDSNYAVGNNGLADTIETSVDSSGLDYNADGNIDTPLDSDNDLKPNFMDLDSDNDGIPDVIEAGGVDGDANGYIGEGNPPTVNLNGLTTRAGILLVDTDADTVYDPYDVDSDNDGITDLVEAGGTDLDNDGRIDGFIDSNSDGLDDALRASPLQLPDSDNDGNSDYKELDSDNDGVFDLVEAGGSDNDNNGLMDAFSDADGDGRNDVFLSSAQGFPDIDADGIPDFQDASNSNNQIKTAVNGYGGCSIGAANSFDPTLLFLACLSGLILLRRARKN